MTMQQDIEKAVSVMRQGGLIAYPTDTVWGIGCDATNSDAVRRVYALKRRADSKALITLVGSPEMLAHTVGEIPEEAAGLIQSSGRPVTVVYPHARGLAPELLAPDGSAGVRLTREAYSAGLCEALGAPVVSTSANVSRQSTPGFYAGIPQEILDGVDYVAMFRRDDNTAALPSMVVKLAGDGTMTILRP